MFRKHPARPPVKKVSALVDKRSHKQRKYISLMLVPSYSSGRTRSLRIPRVVFYCIIITVLAVSAITAGFYLRSEHFADQYRHTRDHLYDTQDTLAAVQAQAEQDLARFIEENQHLYEHLTEEQRNHNLQQRHLIQQQQDALYNLYNQIDALEEMIRDFDQRQQAVIEGLSSRAIIPAVATVLETMFESRAALRHYSTLWDIPIPTVEHNRADVGFVGLSATDLAPLSEETISYRISKLTNELQLQMRLMDELQSYKQQMDPHLRNFPTLWPISAPVSSPFGWRANPMGGGGGEFHSGIDLQSPTGTPIRAAGGGTVTLSGWQGGYGQVVIINHGNGISTLYAHNSANLVYVGQRVERGDIIARVGTTGRTTGAHVHYEVRINGTAVDPRPYMMEHWGQ